MTPEFVALHGLARRVVARAAKPVGGRDVDVDESPDRVQFFFPGEVNPFRSTTNSCAHLGSPGGGIV